jgi:ligand-binding sensor domain-containing protein
MKKENSLRNNNVSAFAELNDGTIWVGTDGGGLHYLKRWNCSSVCIAGQNSAHQCNYRLTKRW